MQSCSSSSLTTSMNLQSHTSQAHHTEIAPLSHHHHIQTHDISLCDSSSSMLGKFLPPLLTQAKGGLSAIPQSTLHDNLQPVITALEKLDAELLLDLERTTDGQGPKVRDGVYCRPIGDQIRPSLGPLNNSEANGHSCVRYLHIAEVPDQYSIGIFVFGPNARIPLHDHPDMCVLSRILYGDLQRLSLDLAREDEAISFLDDYGTRKHQDESSSSSWFRGSWFSRMNSIRNKLPKGSRAAFKNSIDHLQAPGVTVLYPYEGNLHEFVAGPHGAAVLDVLLPPYDNAQNRDCTFYNIHELSSNSCSSEKTSKQPCFIVPTGQPENFHCISGQYRDLGERADDDDDHDDMEEDGDD